MAKVDESGGRWVSAPCWHNCGGRCVVKVLVKDGKVLRSKTDDTHPDSWGWPQSRSCPMGHAMRQQIFGADRLKHPIKRAHWEPFTGGDKTLRGRDEWVQISWDEALDAIAAELKHAKEAYGNRSIFYMNMVNLEGYLGGVLAAFGGYTDCCGTQSTGTFGLHLDMLGYNGSASGTAANDRMDLVNSDYIVLYGHNAAWCAFGNPSYYLMNAKAAGAKFVCVGPDYSATAGMTDAEWIPVRPGEDTALLLGAAYSMLDRDQDGSLIDWDFLNRCTVGFDHEHMPADATTDECFTDYLLGKSDGVPKTPEWASALCGTPVELIERFADIMGCQNKVSINSCAAPARAKGSENFPQMLMTIAAMGGHFGTPGNSCANDQYYSAFNSGGRQLADQPLGGPPYRFSNAGNPVDEMLPTDCMWQNILDGEYWYAGSNFPGLPQCKLEHRDIDIHVIVSEQHNMLQSQSDINKGIAAFRKVDFVCAQAYVLKTDAKYADIVLPIQTRWEYASANLYGGAGLTSDKENTFAWRQVIEPMGECQTDEWIARQLAARLGVDADELIPKSDKQQWFEQMAGNQALQADGEYKKVATITQEDLDRYGVEGEPQEGIEPFEQLLDEGVYRVPREPGDAYTFIPYAEFRADPEGHPIESTKSGKLEIYCQSISDWYDMVNGYADGGSGQLDYVKVSPLPKYLEHPFGYTETKTSPYKFQLTHNHYLRRAHTDCDNLPWLREALENPVFINKADGEAKGIKQGDVIRVFNDQGAFLRPASLCRTIMPGCICIPHGATVRLDEDNGLDLAGADNILTASNRTTTPFLDAWNSVLVDYEKYDGPIKLPRDCDAEPIMPKMVA
ncbi:MAG: molybdopterin-dependent oxidoreductase [Coriobacteriales bacterium]|jgi:anaerobic dimethyl sulfoxide reductase subunit A|nr:molybdopterin-dependent oxidoreductase [Coriobacteriales bacterium]